MSTHTEKIGNLYDKFGSKGLSGILVVVTVSIEEIASFILFECPCDKTHLYYGQWFYYRDHVAYIVCRTYRMSYIIYMREYRCKTKKVCGISSGQHFSYSLLDWLYSRSSGNLSLVFVDEKESHMNICDMKRNVVGTVMEMFYEVSEHDLEWPQKAFLIRY